MHVWHAQRPQAGLRQKICLLHMQWYAPFLTEHSATRKWGPRARLPPEPGCPPQATVQFPGAVLTLPPVLLRNCGCRGCLAVYASCNVQSSSDALLSTSSCASLA